MGRRQEKSSKWKGDRRNLQDGKATGEIFKMERRDRRYLHNAKALQQYLSFSFVKRIVQFSENKFEYGMAIG